MAVIMVSCSGLIIEGKSDRIDVGRRSRRTLLVSFDSSQIVSNESEASMESCVSKVNSVASSLLGVMDRSNSRIEWNRLV